MNRNPLLFAALALAGCTVPGEINPNAPEAPGFEPCALGLAADDDRDFTLCPASDFPFGEDLRGRFLGGPAVFGSPNEVEFEVEGSGETYTVSFYAHFDVGGLDTLFWNEDAPPLVDLRVEAPCDQVDDHVWEVFSTDGALIAAGGSVASWMGGGLSLEGQDASDRCNEALDCDCFSSCRPAALRIDGGVSAELLAGERTNIDGYELRVFESWVGDGASSCPEVEQRRQRWLLIEEAPL